MADLVPSDVEAESSREDGELRVLTLEDEDAERLIGSLSSETARAIISELHGGHATASELADAVDTSLQNVRHHLNNLQEAGLVRVATTRYSVKGREMNVYAPTDDSLVVCVGSESEKERFLDSLTRIVGVVALLAVAALAVERAFGAGVVDLGGPGTVPRIGDSLVGGGTPVFGLLSPGLAFLAGGLLVLVAVTAWTAVRSRSDRGSDPS